MPVYAVEYVYDSRTDLRDELRPRHREFLRGLEADGVLLASGPFTESPGALLLIRAEDADAALGALESDPFAVAGIVTRASARGWTPVIGPWAS